jgi:hypothetical protein
VLAKMGRPTSPHFLDLRIQSADERDLPGQDGRVGGLHGWRLTALRRPQHCLDPLCSGLRVAAVRSAQDGGDLDCDRSRPYRPGHFDGLDAQFMLTASPVALSVTAAGG